AQWADLVAAPAAYARRPAHEIALEERNFRSVATEQAPRFDAIGPHHAFADGQIVPRFAEQLVVAEAASQPVVCCFEMRRNQIPVPRIQPPLRRVAVEIDLDRR